MAAFFEAQSRHEDAHQLHIESTVLHGDQAAALCRCSARVTNTGKFFHSPAMQFLTVRDHKICRLVQMLDTSAVAEAYQP